MYKRGKRTNKTDLIRHKARKTKLATKKEKTKKNQKSKKKFVLASSLHKDMMKNNYLSSYVPHCLIFCRTSQTTVMSYNKTDKDCSTL